MFGYVTVGKDQLTEKEYSTFRAYYCGLCRATGQCASQAARLGLSYDITFLALVLSSLYAEDCKIKSGHCIAHSKARNLYVIDDESVNYASAMGVLLEYLKLADDWHDDHSLKALLGMLILHRGYAKVKKGYKKQYKIIKEQLSLLSDLEKSRCTVIDEAADVFAKILEALFVPEFIKTEAERRALAWLGYNLGRWIYIIDAYNDLEDDIKSGSYNPLSEAGFTAQEDCLKRIELSLTLTLGNIASAYELIDFKQNKEIIGKMVYISLKEKQRYILSGGGHSKQKKGLTDESI